MRSSLRQAPTELLIAEIVPAVRSRAAKLLTGRSTTPAAGVT
jgi:hypothetical protein